LAIGFLDPAEFGQWLRGASPLPVLTYLPLASRTDTPA